MYAKHLAAFAALFALAEQALAIDSQHRHLHREAEAEVDKRSVATNWQTVWETVYVYADGPAKAAATPAVAAPKQAQPPAAQQPPAAKQPAPAPKQQQPNSPAPKQQQSQQPQQPQQPPASSQKQSPPAAAPSASAPKAPTGGLPFSSKRGIAYNDAQLANTFGSQCPSCSWGYNWANARQGFSSKYSHVPTLWGLRGDFTGPWFGAADQAIASGAKALFSFNEPDNAGQANLSPAAAAAGHVKYMNRYSGKALIGAPSISNSNLAGEGTRWLRSFVNACNQQQEKCKYDFCNVHWYSPASASQTLFDHIKEAYEICGKPIWLTEFAPLDEAANGVKFMNEVIPKLDAIPYLHAYSYFMVKQGTMMTSPNTMSAFGRVYAQV